MTVRVIGLDYSLTESMLEGNDEAIVIRDPNCAKFSNPTKPWIGARGKRRARTQRGGERSKTPSVCRRIIKRYVNPMMAEVTDAQGSSCPNGLLQFEIPLLILRRVEWSPRTVECRWKELRNFGLDLREGFTSREPVDERRVRTGSILKEAGSLVGCEVVIGHLERVDEWRIGAKGCEQ